MTKIKQIKKIIPHPFFAAMFPLLFLISHNIREIHMADAVQPALFMLALFAVLYAASFLLLKNQAKAALVVTIFFFLFFTYGHIYTSCVVYVPIKQHRYWMALWVLLMGGFFFAVLKTKRDFRIITTFLNVFTFILVANSLVVVIYEKSRSSMGWLSERNREAAQMKLPAVKNLKKPDIYYIVFDRYAGTKTLTRFLKFDNSGVIGFLENKGFFVPEDNVCNYPATVFSLSSSLNMTYLTWLEGKPGITIHNGAYYLINDATAPKLLKSIGYEYYHVGPSFSFTRTNRLADRTFNAGVARYLNETSFLLFKTTITYFMYDKYYVASDERSRTDVLGQFQALAGIPGMDNNGRPKYVFAHFILPHPPYVFKSDGSALSSGERGKLSEYQMYIGQLEFTNTLIEKLVDDILKKSKAEPIIIILSDEGPPLTSVDSRYKLAAHCHNFTAIYFPGYRSGGNSLLYSKISPVNIFRVIFNQYFNADFKLLPDECRNIAKKDSVIDTMY